MGCVPQRYILTPVQNSELRKISDKLIYTEIAEEHKKSVIFNGAYEGFQCSPEIVDLDTFLEEENFELYESFKCICYVYKVRTEQGNDLYVGIQNGFYLNTRVCYDSNKSIVELPKIENLKLAVTKSKSKHINVSKVESITVGEVNHDSKTGKFPVLVYETYNDRLVWKVRRYHGKLNVTVHEFDIDGETGEILSHKRLPYRKTFWQWIGGTGI
jgi:hypothetical protein